MPSSDYSRLAHIQNYCVDIADYIDRFGDYDAFTSDSAYHNAVSMCILQIGELANGLTEEFRAETKEHIPWGLIRGMRNWIAHSYNETDDNIIWETITESIPDLLQFCNNTLDQYEDEEQELDQGPTLRL